MSTLAERFAELLAERPEVKLVDLARACGIKQPSVSAWLTGKTKQLEASNAIRAAAFFGVHTWWLATGEGPKYLKPGEVDRHREPASEKGDWPFSARMVEYERLPAGDKKALNRVVSGFIEGVTKES